MKFKKILLSLLISSLFTFIIVPGLSLTTTEVEPLKLHPPTTSVT